jgi:hypothetical protein
VILWSNGKENDYPNDPNCHPKFADMTANNDANKPASERRYSPDKPSAERLVTLSRQLSALVRKWDATRPVTAAVAFPELSNITGYCDTLDVCGYNYKEMWYDEDHAKYPCRVLLGTENGSGYPEWTAVRDRDYISGQFLWTGFDFLGEAHGWPIHGSMAGQLTLAGFEKPGYYFRKSLWAAEPMVQLVTARKVPDGTHPWRLHAGDALSWNYTPGEEITVYCYTNCPSVEILLNGMSKGTFKLTDFIDDGHITCTVAYEAGTLEAAATAQGGTVVTSALSTAQAPSAMLVTPDCTELKADGEDIAQLEVTVVDGRGNWVTNASDMISVTVEGSGTLLGVENGDQADNTEYSSAQRRAHHGKLLAYIRSNGQAGPVKVIFRSVGSLREAVVELTAR